MYICRHFAIQELVPRHVYNERGQKAWELFDDRSLRALDALREKYGRMIINDWMWSGCNQWRGLRSGISPVGSEYSQHRFGRAFDVTFSDKDIEDVRNDILVNPEEYPLICSVELGVNWLHFDMRNCSRLKTYYP